MARRLYVIGLISFMALFIFTLQTETLAANNKMYDVGTDNLNVRTSPSHDASVIGHLQQGQQVNGFNEKHGWVQTYYDGELAWVASQYLIETKNNGSKNVSNDHKDVTVTATDVNIRSGPDTNHKVIASTTSGKTYKKIDSTGDWVKVALSNDEGWISADLTSHGASKKGKTKQNKQKKASGGRLDGINIVLDPGHGGKDPGAIGLNHVQEKDLVRTTVASIKEHLQQKGATVMSTRSADSYISLDQRIGVSNAYNTDAFVSIHYDASPFSEIRGTSTYYFEGGNDKKLAQHIHKSLVHVNNVRDRGIKHGNFKVLRENADLAILIEMGFITNQNELAMIESQEFQENAAEAITDGLVNYFNQ